MSTVPDRSPLGFPQLVARFVAEQRSEHTRSAYGADLRRFAGWCEAGGIDPLAAGPSDVERFRTDCEADGAAAATVARRLAALGSFFAFTVAAGATPSSPVDQVARPGHGVPVVAAGAPSLGAAEVDALAVAAADLDPKTALLVDLLLLDGLKLGEVLAADADDLTEDDSVLTVTRRAGSVEVGLHDATVAAAHAYLHGRTTGPLLLSDRPGRGTARLTRFGADYLLKRAGEVAGIDRPLSANALRRSHVALAHEAGEPVEAIRDRLGHADTRTTRRLTEA